MAGSSEKAGDDAKALCYDVVARIDVDAVGLCHDDTYLYVASREGRVQVWSKESWKSVATLGETSTPPLCVLVDADHVYAICERRVYVWQKATWGMIGWFELSYQAVTADIQGSYLYIGAKDGRLVAIRTDTRDTSSWTLHKSDITGLWADRDVICTVPRKGSPCVWSLPGTKQPEEVVSLERKERAVSVAGNSECLLVALANGKVDIWDRSSWSLDETVEASPSGPVVSMWANDLFMVAATMTETISLWDMRRVIPVGELRVERVKFDHVLGDCELLYVTAPTEVLVLRILYSDRVVDLCSDSGIPTDEGLLRTSPYDVLEMILQHRERGDELLRAGSHHEAVAEYERALQVLVDSARALLEVPEERERLSRDLNSRLGRALLRAKIDEVQQLRRAVAGIVEELESEGRLIRDVQDVHQLWLEAGHVLKESSILSEAQGGNVLSFQLMYEADQLRTELDRARRMVDDYLARVNEVRALTQSMLSEWRWLERRRTALPDRTAFLERAMDTLRGRLESADGDPEVENILREALAYYQGLHDKIGRIISSTQQCDELPVSRDDALSAVRGLLGVLPARLEALTSTEDTDRHATALESLVAAINEAIELAKKFKFKDELSELEAALEGLTEGKGEDSE